MTANSIVDLIFATASVIVAISVSTERIVEIVKRVIPTLETIPAGTKKVLVHIMSVAIGTVVSLTGMSDIQRVVPYIDTVYECVFLGLMASGGGSLWHDLLGIVLEVKNSKATLTKAA